MFLYPKSCCTEHRPNCKLMQTLGTASKQVCGLPHFLCLLSSAPSLHSIPSGVGAKITKGAGQELVATLSERSERVGDGMEVKPIGTCGFIRSYVLSRTEGVPLFIHANTFQYIMSGEGGTREVRADILLNKDKETHNLATPASLSLIRGNNIHPVQNQVC